MNLMGLPGLAGDLLDGKGGATARIAVELGEDDAVELELFVEDFGGVDGVLTGHGVEDEVDLLRADGLGDFLQFVHQLFVDGQAPGGVENDYIAVCFLRGDDAIAADFHCVLVAALGVNGNTNLLADDFQLIDSRRALEVGGYQHGSLGFVEQHLGHLAASGGLAGALQSGHKQHGWPRCHKGNFRIDRAHESDKFVVDDFDHDLCGFERIDNLSADRLFLHLVAELFRDFEVDVGFEQGSADLAHHLGDVGLGDLSASAQTAKYIRELVG
jgi:hypothetical protein